MHPHENPVYREKIVKNFKLATSLGHLNLEGDTEYQENKKNKKSEFKTYRKIEVLCLSGTFLFDRYYLRKLTGEMALLWRLLGVSIGLTMSLWVTPFVVPNIWNDGITIEMVLKHEKQLLVLYPKLKLYYLGETKLISTDSSKQSQNDDDRSFGHSTPTDEYPSYEDQFQTPKTNYPSYYLYPGEKK